MIDEYFDEYLLAADPALLRDVAAEMARCVPVDTETLVGLELGGIPLTMALSAATGVPAGFLQRERKCYGTRRQLEGHPVAGKRVVLVDDVVRSGFTSASSGIGTAAGRRQRDDGGLRVGS
ncbi:MAG: phosphoribosyltransferase family protein [Pseudonocardia sp.]